MLEIILLILTCLLVIGSIIFSISQLIKKRRKKQEIQEKMNPLAEEKKEDELFAFRQLFGGETK